MSGSNKSNWLDCGIIIALIGGFFVALNFSGINSLLWVIVGVGALPTVWGAFQAIRQRRINIDVFNVFALATASAYGEVRSASFIVLMLTFARLLDRYTESRTHRTLEELLKLKPQTALRERDGVSEEVPASSVAIGDIVVVKDGARVPVDGTIIFGQALINEAAVTGESVPVEKVVGDSVLSSTLNESGLLKVRAVRVGQDSTIERMVLLVQAAAKNKSRSERLADRFAAIFLPIVLVVGAVTYIFTRNLTMTAALFLVACADDMAVAIPLAVTAALGKAARRGVVIKGGEWIETLSKLRTVILDKTGTLTYGSFTVQDVEIETGVAETEFWQTVGIAEKFSNHPIGRTIFKEAIKRITIVPDPAEFRVYKGSGSVSRYNGDTLAVGNVEITSKIDTSLDAEAKLELKHQMERDGKTWSAIFKNGKLLGLLSVGDVPRVEAKSSIDALRQLGVTDIQMFTGDNPIVAYRVAETIGIKTVRAAMTPEQKLQALEQLGHSNGLVAMIGDGVNDAAALARADVGIAMGSGGTAVAVEAADVVILNDDLSRLPEIIRFSRQVMTVVRWDMVLWLLSNILGFALVLTGVIGPALAAFYNFISDFFPLINSARLFRTRHKEI